MVTIVGPTKNKMAASGTNDEESYIIENPGDYKCDENTAMDISVDQEKELVYRVDINDLPDEILEYIIKLVSPYQDFRSCSRVSQRWRNLCLIACNSKLLAFHNQISEGELLWKGVLTEQSPDNVSRRHSHSAVYNDKYLSMFIFGGCTASSSTFNDLLQFDLSNRTWIRPRAMGSYPSPKALATLVTNDDILLLFGGWTHPSVYPLHQTWKLFSELHIFNLLESKWTQIKFDMGEAWPPKTAGHSATLHGDKMVIFGGLTMQRGSENLSFQCSNNLWVFNLASMSWNLQTTAGQLTPSGRYGQSQIYLDESHLLILGGWLGTSNTDLTDVWLLQMDHHSGDWRWHELKVEGVEHRPKDISRHPAARAAKDRVVVLAKSKIPPKKSQSTKSRPTMIIRNAIGSVPSNSRGHYHHHNNASSSSEENDQVEPRRSRNLPSHHTYSETQQLASGSRSHQGVGEEGVEGPPERGGAVSNQVGGSTQSQPGSSACRTVEGGAGPNQENARLQREVAGLHAGGSRPQPGSSGSSDVGAGASARPQSSNLSGGAWLHQHQERESQAFCGVPAKSVKQRMLENRQRQLASLNRMEEKLNKMEHSSGRGPPVSGSGGGGERGVGNVGERGSGGGGGGAPPPQHNPAPPQLPSPSPVCPNHRMMMNILDTSRAITEHTVKWLPPNPRLPGVDVAQEVDLYSLVQGRTELILFGGLKRDISIRGAPPNHSTRDSSSVTNNLHILYPQLNRI